jgi:hypothetical protein
MPRYHTLGSAVVLCSWDPAFKAEKDYNRNELSNSSSKPSTAAHQAALPPKSTRLHTDGPAAGYLTEDIREEYFDGQEGVDFISNCMPFFLIHAGADLFAPPQSSHKDHRSRQQTPQVVDDQAEQRSSASKNGTMPINTPTEGSETESILSSISSTRFASEANLNLGEDEMDVGNRMPLSDAFI